MSKQKQQAVILSLILVIILGVVGYVYRDAFLPKPVGDALGLTAPARQALPTELDYDSLFERPDYDMLEKHGDVPVQVFGLGNKQLFHTEPRDRGE